jgi:4'-phosphopantetheinyl transferase
VLLRLLAAAHLGLDPAAISISRDCPDCNRPHGRPILPAAGWECSVSHSGDRVAVAIGRTGALGVDVEDSARRSVGEAAGTGLGEGAADRTAGSPDDGLVTYALTRREAADLAAYTEAYTANHPGTRLERDGLLAYWTRKEAVLKAIGTGLREPLRGIEVSAPDTEPRLLSAASDPTLPGRTVLRGLDPGEGYVASLAVLDTPAPVVTEHDATALLTSG